MSKVPVHNNTKMPIYVGTSMVPPGETRIFDEHHVPEHLRPKQTESAQTEALNPDAELLATLDQSVPKVTAALAERDDNGLPVISDEDMAKLKAAEEAGNTRSSLMAAIQEEELTRAKEQQDREDELASSPEAQAAAEFVTSLQDKSTEDLQEMLDQEPDEGKKALITEQLDKLAGGDNGSSPEEGAKGFLGFGKKG